MKNKSFAFGFAHDLLDFQVLRNENFVGSYCVFVVSCRCWSRDRPLFSIFECMRVEKTNVRDVQVLLVTHKVQLVDVYHFAVCFTANHTFMLDYLASEIHVNLIRALINEQQLSIIKNV